jgi:hypothetical protein
MAQNLSKVSSLFSSTVDNPDIMQSTVVWVYSRADVITWMKFIQYSLAFYRVVRCALSCVPWNTDVFDLSGVVCGVETLDFPKKLDSSFCAAIFGDHKTTQAANGD